MGIIIIDDDLMILKVFSKLLEKLGYNAATFDKGLPAIEYYKANQEEIQLIILDMKLNDMTGADVFREIKRINSHQKVLVATGYGLDREVQRLLEEGVTDYLEKPFTLDVLRGKLAKFAPQTQR